MVRLFNPDNARGRLLSRVLHWNRGDAHDEAQRPEHDFRTLVQDYFDAEFFAAGYRDVFPKAEKLSDTELLNLYLRFVAEKRLDPSSAFSESGYVEMHADVKAAVSRGEFACGFHHWLVHGSREGRRTRPSDMAQALNGFESPATPGFRHTDVFRRIPRARWAKFFDRKWYVAHLKETHGQDVPEKKAMEFFLNEGLWRGDVPTPAFDEDFYLSYYEDVQAAKEAGAIPSGFAHFMLNGEMEGRLPAHDLNRCLKGKLGVLAEPVSLQNEPALERKFRRPLMKLNPRKKWALNVFVPSLDPDIMFGGYIAFLHFLCRASEQGTQLRFIVTEDGQSNRAWFLRNIRERWRNAFENAEFCNVARDVIPVIECTPDDICIAYSAWAAFLADDFAKSIGERKFLYFIQEDERIFHCNNALHFFVSGAYRLNHAAIFNTSVLTDHFRSARLGVFASKAEEGPHVTFEHAIGAVRPDIDTLRGKKRKRLFVYSRPEGHAGRNLFEICVMVLRRCVEAGILDDSWDIVGVGSMGVEGEVELGPDVKLEIRSRVEQGSYERLLQSFDVGISLMWAPHPSVIPYELARAGVVCVTNTYGDRDKSYFSRFGYNIVAAEPTIDDLCEGVREAVRRSDDLERRVSSCEIAWPTDWDSVFDQTFVSRALALVKKP